MSQTITRLFDSHTQAMSAVRALEDAGIRHDRVSLIADNSEGWHGADRASGEMGERGERGEHGERGERGDNETAEGAGKGATTGGLLGGGAGLLAGLGMLAIPGVGPVVAAGWLASTALGAVVGAVAGGATGGLLGALKDAGESEEDAHVYAEGVRRGGSLVSVKADDSDVSRVNQILDSNRGVSAATRGGQYRETGWSRYDADAPAYTSDQRRQERARYSSM